MTEDNLKDLIKKILALKCETNDIEIKAAAYGCPKRLYDTLSSFSNQDNGGVILFGIDETKDFEIVGVYDPQDLEKQVVEQCKQMEPQVRGQFSATKYNNKIVCALEVPGIDLTERPCYYKGAGIAAGSYLRVGDSDAKMTAYEIYSYEAFRKRVYDDERPIRRTNKKVLNQNLIDEYIAIKTRNKPNFRKLDKKLMEQTLNIMIGTECSLASLLVFGLYPQAFLPQLCITAVVVPGTEISDTDDAGNRFLDNERIEGTINEILEQTLIFCKRNMKIRTVVDPNTGLRKDKTEYPIVAIREAVINALIHRDYSINTEGTPIQIYFYNDRMEIHSPGTLFGRITVEQLGFAKPDLRNPTLAIMAETMLQVENRYSGIPTMRAAMKEYGLPEPEFKNMRNEFVVTFRNNETICNDTLDIIEKAILEFCKTPKSRKEIAQYVGVKTTTYLSTAYLKPMVAAGKLGLTLPNKPRSKYQKYYTVPI